MKKMVIAKVGVKNEEGIIDRLLSALNQFCEKIIIVDDGSTDDTAWEAEEAGAKVVRHKTNRGYGATIQTILADARGLNFDALVIMDSDNQHFPADIPNMANAVIDEGYELVIGKRSSYQIPKFRYVGGWVLSLFTRILTGAKVVDSQSGFRAYSRRAVQLLYPKENGMAIGSEIISEATKLGLSITEVPIFIRYTSDSSSHNPIYQGFYTLFKVIGMIIRRKMGK